MIFLFLIILFIRSPWGQGIIKDKAISYLENKTNTTISLGKFYLSFSGNIVVDEFYIEDLAGDTLLYSERLSADIPLWPIIAQNKLELSSLDWQGVRARISRPDRSEDFNYQFLIDAFTSDTDTEVKTDTIANPMTILVKNIHLSDIRASYKDELTGMDGQVILGNLKVAMDNFDLDHMNFSVQSATLDDTHVEYILSKDPPPSDTESSGILPQLILNHIHIKNLTGLYHSDPDEMHTDFDIQSLQLRAPQIDLENQNIQITTFALSQSSIGVHLLHERIPAPTEPETSDEDRSSMASFVWPEWLIQIDEINLKENDFSYLVGESKITPGTFNPDAIDLSDFDLNLKNLYLKNKTAGGQLQKISLMEGSGIGIDDITFDINITDQMIGMKNFEFSGMNSYLKGELTSQFSKINDLIALDKNVRFDIDFPDIRVDTREALRFSPELANDEYFSVFSRDPVRATLHASGTLSDMKLKDTRLNWGRQTKIFIAGTIQNLPDPDRIKVHLPAILLQSGQQDLAKLMDEEQLGIRIPERFRVEGDVSGYTNDMTATALLQSTVGHGRLNGRFSNKDQLIFDLEAEIDDFHVDSIMPGQPIGILALTLDLTGSGQDLETLNADFDTQIKKLQIDEYLIENWPVSGHVENGIGTIRSTHKDENIDVALHSDFVIDSISPSIQADLHLSGADLAALGLMDRPVAIAFDMNAAAKGNTDEYEASLQITSGTVVHQNQSYKTGDINLDLFGTKDTTSVELTNSIVNMALHSNSSFATISQALQNHISHHLRDTVVTDDSVRIQPPVHLALNMEVTEAPVLKEVFLPGLDQMDTLSLGVIFDETRQKLDARLYLPHLLYSGMEIDSVHLVAFSDQEDFKVDIGLEKIGAGPVTINKTRFLTKIKDQKLYSILNAKYEDQDLILVRIDAEQDDDIFKLHLHPDSLIVDSKRWDIPASNEMIYADSIFRFQDFILSHDIQKFSIGEGDQNSVKIEFENFEMGNIVGYLNPDTLLASGKTDGFIEVFQPLSPLRFETDIRVKDFKIYEEDIGTLTITARSQDEQLYQGNLSLKGGEIEGSAIAEYSAREEDDQLKATVDIQRIEMSALEAFSLGELQNGSGYISGGIEVSGSALDPQYSGELHFSDAGFMVTMLDVSFFLNQEYIRFDNEGIRFDNFEIRDEEEHVFMINGTIGTENFQNPVFDLKLEADDFQILNSEKENSDLFYGQAIFDVNASITGDLKLPKVNVDLDIGKNTNITYIMPQAQAKLERRDGIVLFVNKENPDDILARQEEESVIVTGYDINAVISLDKEAIFEVIISEETGDHFMVSGEGDLNFSILPNGQIQLTGLVEIEDGHYEMNLYNLVTRRFDIVKGSKVSWSGDMMDADLDVSTRYQVETSPYSMMAPRTSGADVNVKNQYRRKLPFLVYLNIGGSLNQPRLDFNIDMPEDAQGAAGGQVYGQIQQLNDQEQELNKQVFSLLVLGQFYPDSGNDGSGGGIENVARDNINQALSDQLNMFSDRLLGDTGIELDFGLDTYTDYEGGNPQRRTELDIAAQKKFLDDRLIVKVGSEVDVEGGQGNPQENNPLIGNVSVEYLLTEKGNFRIRGFRKNTFENVIDGQTIVSGLALIFTQEFNKFDQLWREMFLKRSKESEKQ